MITAIYTQGRNFTPLTKQSFSIVETIRAFGVQIVNRDEENGGSGGITTTDISFSSLSPPYRGSKWELSKVSQLLLLMTGIR